MREHAAGPGRRGRAASRSVRRPARDSRRFRRALDLADHALAHSDLDVLRAIVGTLDPGTWLDRAAHTRRPGRREALAAVARALERLDLWAAVQAMFRRVQADHLRCARRGRTRRAWQPREVLLHALRLALIQRIWLLGDGDPGLLAPPRRDPAGPRGRPAAPGRAGRADAAGRDLPRRRRPVDRAGLRRDAGPAGRRLLPPRARDDLRADARDCSPSSGRSPPPSATRSARSADVPG